MTFFPDLAPCTYFELRGGTFGPPVSECAIAVGWLENALPGPAGTPAELDVIAEKLVQLQRWEGAPWGYEFGYHGCGLCGAASRAPTTLMYRGEALQLGTGYITVPAHRGLYVAPNLIIHYVVHHQYLPPLEFRAALLACPDPQSDDYVRLVQTHGPWWLRWVHDEFADEIVFHVPWWRRMISAQVDWTGQSRNPLQRALRQVISRL